jgi:hypothetical protein
MLLRRRLYDLPPGKYITNIPLSFLDLSTPASLRYTVSSDPGDCSLGFS